MMHDYLPISRADMNIRGWKQCDFVYITGDAYVDHPSFGHAIISRILEAHGYKVGIIAAGDNHSVPGVFEHGSMCALAADNTKEAIWDAFVNRRVYGVSQSRIEVDFTVDGVPMGGEVETGGEVELELHVKGTSAVDRVEILRDNVLEEICLLYTSPSPRDTR